MPDQKYDLPLPEAIVELKGQLAKMRAQLNRNELLGVMSVDEALEKGYELCIFDLEHYTGPEPTGFESHLTIAETKNDD